MLDGRYELDREIGRGGMGSVWLGRDTVLGRAVALKQIGMAPGGGALDLDRAEREAHLAARINHQNVVAVFDLVADGGLQWLVMEHIDGPTLAGLIAEHGAYDPEALAPVVMQVAGALAAAHEHGIVHRDVKPSNILLTRDGIAKLSDFGIARAQADASLTQTGLVTGSPAYLSPEVATGRTATAASDVWSLGATVFHSLAGHPPYEVGDNVLGAMYRIVHEDPPRLEGGGLLAPLVEAMMQRDPDARPTMAEVERAVTGSATALVDPGHAAEPTVALDLEATQGFSPFAEDAGPRPTTAFRPLGEPIASPVEIPSADDAANDNNHRGRGPRRLWLAAGAVAAIIIITAFAVIPGGKDHTVDTPSAKGGSGQSTSPSADKTPTAKALEGFAADYLVTASNDPDEGFALLTPGYQQESGGLPGYTAFWGGVSGLDVQTVRGNPESLTVSYTYAYDFGGSRRTEAVTLQLEKSGDSFLISGTA